MGREEEEGRGGEEMHGEKEEEGELALYPHPQGYLPLREYLSEKLTRDRKLSVSAEDIMLGEGSSQLNHMIIEALVDPGDVVLTEDFTYPGTLGFLLFLVVPRGR